MDLTLLLPRRTIEITEMGTLHQKHQQNKHVTKIQKQARQQHTHTHTEHVTPKTSIFQQKKTFLSSHHELFHTFPAIWHFLLGLLSGATITCVPTTSIDNRHLTFSWFFGLQFFNAMLRHGSTSKNWTQLTCCWKVLHKWETSDYTSDDDDDDDDDDET